MLSVLALTISLASLAIVIWDKFLRRAEFTIQADWIMSASEPTLRLVICNVGSRKGSVRDLRFKERAMPVGRGWTPYGRVMSKLPLVLDADEASPAFLLQPDPNSSDLFEDALRTGRINSVEVEDARGACQVFDLPELHVAKHNAMTNAGPEMPRSTP